MSATIIEGIMLLDTEAAETRALVNEAARVARPRRKQAVRWAAAATVALFAACAVAGLAGRLASTAASIEDNFRIANVGGAVKLHFDQGRMEWRGLRNDTKCLDVEAGHDFAGAHVQVWDCISKEPDQQFVYPRSHGMIQWKKDPKLCLRPLKNSTHNLATHIVTNTATGKINESASIKNPIVLWPCNETDKYLQWVMPEKNGPIRSRLHPTKCIVEDDVRDLMLKPDEQNGFDAHLGDCPSDDPLDPLGETDPAKLWYASLHWSEGQLQMQTPNGVICLRALKPNEGEPVTVGWCQSKVYSQFVFPGKTGLIRWNAYPHLCVEVANGNYTDGAPLQLSQCNETVRSMIWSVPSGPGPMRLRHHDDMCIGEAQTGEKLRVYKCGQSPHKAKVPWSCHSYTKGQDNAWCLTAGMKDGTEYAFRAGGGMCGSDGSGNLCWCCKRPAWGVAQEEDKEPTAEKDDEESDGESDGEELEPWSNQTWNIIDQPKWSGGFPSLYCLAVIRPQGYEMDIMRTLLSKAPEGRKDFGIFACDDFQLFSSQRVKVGWHHRKGDIYAEWFKQAWVGVSKDGTAGNAELFIHLWGRVAELGAYNNYDWTVKVDPDAVVIPHRIRDHLNPHNWHTPQYVANCNMWPGNPDYPMIFGALEVYSKEAMQRYSSSTGTCMGMDWHPLGEDLFMKRCMQMLGIQMIFDANIVGDRLCGGYANCGETYKAAFHSFKSVDSWLGCWYQADR